jgi:hypothetical protein
MPTLLLAGKPVEVDEPVLKNLRKIIAAYNVLSRDAAMSEKVQAVETILAGLSIPLKLRQFKAGELEALLQALPDICHLKTTSDKASPPKGDIQWGELYAHLSMCFGWTYREIDEQVKLSQINEYQAYFEKFPPVHQLVAAYLGYEPEKKQDAKSFLANIAAQVKASQRIKPSQEKANE